MHRVPHTALCDVLYFICVRACVPLNVLDMSHAAYWLSHLDTIGGGPQKIPSLFSTSSSMSVRGGVPSATNEKKQLDRADRSAVGLV